jgi:hypothetical protein
VDELLQASREWNDTVDYVLPSEPATTVDEAEPQEENSNQAEGRQQIRHERTIGFDELYQDGHAKFMHRIVEFPRGSNHWYILKCKHRHFKYQMWTGPIHHVSRQHRGSRKGKINRRDVIEEIGWLVHNCNAEKAEMNNAAFSRLLAIGYRPFNSKYPNRDPMPSTSLPQASAEVGPNDAEASSRQGRHHRVKSRNNAYHQPGDICSVDHFNKSFAAVVLSLGSFEVIGACGSIEDTGLLDCIPKCYSKRLTPGHTLEWARGYEDGGPNVDQREYPIWFIDNDNFKIPQEGDFWIPRTSETCFDWMSVEFLNSFNFESPVSKDCYGYDRAKEFRIRFDSMATKQASRATSSHHDGWRNGDCMLPHPRIVYSMNF